MHNDDQTPHVPARLAEDLRRAYQAELPSAALDWSRAELQLRRSNLLSRRWFAAAAVLVLCGSLTLLLLRSPARSKYDLNADGVADVLDALTLVRAIRDGNPPSERGGDFNRDGRVDQTDVDAVMTEIVRLPGESR